MRESCLGSATLSARNSGLTSSPVSVPTRPVPTASRTRPRAALLGTLALLYTAQGIPFGFASEYIPVLLREAHYSRTRIAALFWLQLPWQIKVLWAHIPDRPGARAHARGILLGLQVLLALLVAAYAPLDLRTAVTPWFVLTALCALVAATQDTFVDGLAVRSLLPEDRGFGNIAQVAGYRLGMLVGGAGLLLVVDGLGQPLTVVTCGAIIAATGLGAFILRDSPVMLAAESNDAPRKTAPETRVLAAVRALFTHVFRRETLAVALLAMLYKLGPHLAGALIKPMVVDAHWTRREIGWAVVTVGTTASLVGAALGGWVHRALRDRRALALGALVHAVSIAPLVAARLAGVPHGLTVSAIAAEHFASGLGTTVLFAALMTATRPSQAAMHYTLLTSFNALAIGLGGMLGGLLGDHLGEVPAFSIAVVASLGPLWLMPAWDRSARASAAESVTPAPR